MALQLLYYIFDPERSKVKDVKITKMLKLILTVTSPQMVHDCPSIVEFQEAGWVICCAINCRFSR